MGGSRGWPTSYGRGARVAENTGALLDRRHSDDRASTHPTSRTCPGSEIAQSVQASSSCSSRCGCVSATDCQTQSTNPASKVHRCSRRRGLGNALVMRSILQKPTTWPTHPERESGRGESTDRGRLSSMRSAMSYSAFRLSMGCGAGRRLRAPLRSLERYVITYLFRGRQWHMALESKPPIHSHSTQGLLSNSHGPV